MKPRKLLTLEDRVALGLAAHAKEDGDCLIWTGTLSQSGKHPKYSGLVMRRAVWETHHGPLAKKDRVTVTCDNPKCLMHLKKTTVSEISSRVNADPRVKAAKRVASANWQRANNAKLTMEKAREIRASSESRAALAARFGVDDSLISKVMTGASWMELVASPFAGLGARA